jgi:hypothetical protein
VIVAVVIAAAAILGGIIVVAMGRGGELSIDRPELPSRTDFQSSADIADYRPPAALIGYSAVATEQALSLIARTIAERDAEIDWLRRRLAELQPESLPDESIGTSAGSPGGEGLPGAVARWQGGGTPSGVANGSGDPQPVSPRGGDE